MTRAAERLIIAGYHGPRGKARDCWHDMARAGLEAGMKEAPSPWSADESVLRLGEPWREAGGAAGPERVAPRQAPPGWLRARAAFERPPTPLRPSSLFGVPSPGGLGAAAADRLEAGRLSHSLLQYLPDLPPDQRRTAALRYLARRVARLPTSERDAIVERVLRVMRDERLAALFGPNSRAEVAITAQIGRPGHAPTPFSGRIDRLAIGRESVEIVDFKSGASPAGPPSPYLAQLALYRAALQTIYPGRPARAFLVWLENAEVAEVEPAALDDALAKLLNPL